MFYCKDSRMRQKTLKHSCNFECIRMKGEASYAPPPPPPSSFSADRSKAVHLCSSSSCLYVGYCNCSVVSFHCLFFISSSAGTQRWNNVDLTLIQRRRWINVETTLFPRYVPREFFLVSGSLCFVVVVRGAGGMGVDLGKYLGRGVPLDWQNIPVHIICM